MKKLTTILALSLSATSFAQVGSLILKKSGSLLNKKASSSDTTSTQSGASQTGTTTTNQSSETTANPWASKMGSKADAQAEYNFNSNVFVEIQNFKKDGSAKDEASKVRYHFSETDYYGTEMVMTDKKGKVTESFGVTEFSKNQTISLISNDGEKTGMVMKIDMQKQIDKKSDSTGVTVTKSGKTKTILTYSCEEYIITDKDGNTTEAWMTTSLPFDMKKMMAGAKGNTNTYGNFGDGFMMEMTMTEKGGGKTTWKVLEVNLNSAKKVVTADYTFPY